MQDNVREFADVDIKTHSVVVDEGQRKAMVHSTHTATLVEWQGGKKRVFKMAQFFDVSKGDDKEKVVRFVDTAVAGQHAAEVVAKRQQHSDSYIELYILGSNSIRHHAIGAHLLLRVPLRL